MELLIIIPVYNESGCIEKLIQSYHQYFDAYFNSKEAFRILVVNDGSVDETPSILSRLTSEIPSLIVHDQENGGHGHAVLQGYQTAMTYNPNYIFQIDGDDQFEIIDFDKLWEKRELSHFIIGNRKKRYDNKSRLVISTILKKLNKLLFGVYIEDCNIPFRLMNAPYLKTLLKDLVINQALIPNVFLAVMAKLEGQNLLNITVAHKSRSTGKGSIVKWSLIVFCMKSMIQILEFRTILKSKKNYLNESNKLNEGV